MRRQGRTPARSLHPCCHRASRSLSGPCHPTSTSGPSGPTVVRYEHHGTSRADALRTSPPTATTEPPAAIALGVYFRGRAKTFWFERTASTESTSATKTVESPPTATPFGCAAVENDAGLWNHENLCSQRWDARILTCNPCRQSRAGGRRIRPSAPCQRGLH